MLCNKKTKSCIAKIQTRKMFLSPQSHMNHRAANLITNVITQCLLLTSQLHHNTNPSSHTAMAGQTIVILGGSIAGLGIAHRLLKYTLPKCKDLEVVLVSKVRP
jgi:hypothetical protein